MTASERMAGLVEKLLDVAHARGVTAGNGDPWERMVACSRARDDARTALLAAIGEIEQARDAQAAEVRRLRLDATNARAVAEEALDFHEALRRTIGRPPTCARTDDLRARLATPDPAAFVARPLADYHEDHGSVLWWKFPINEPPYVGTTLDDDWPGYHTHWTPLPPCPDDPALLALGGAR